MKVLIYQWFPNNSIKSLIWDENLSNCAFALLKKLTQKTSLRLLLSERESYAMKRQKDTLLTPERKRPGIYFNNHKHQNHLGI